MPALESRYDHESSTASSDEEDFTNASPPRSASARGVSRTASRASSSRGKAHSSSSSESTDSEEEAALREELADAGGDLEAGVVRGAPVEGRVERVMRSIGKGGSGGSRGTQRYAALDDDRSAGREVAERRHMKKHNKERSAGRGSSSGRMYALGKDDPSGTPGAGAPAAYADAGDDLEAGAAPAKRSSSKRSSKSGRAEKSSKKGSSWSNKGAAGGAGEGDGDGAPVAPLNRKRRWCYLFVGLVLLIVIALVVVVVVKVVKDKQATTEAGSEATAASDAVSSAHSTGSASESGAHGSSAASHEATTGTALDSLALTASSSESANDGQYHASSVTSAATSAASSAVNNALYSPASSAATAASSSQASQFGQWGSVDPSQATHTDSSALVDPHASLSSGAVPSVTTGGNVHAQTTMPPGVSAPSSSPSSASLDFGTGNNGWGAPSSAQPADPYYSASISSFINSALSSAAGELSLSASLPPLGPGPVSLPSPLSSSLAGEATATGAPAWGAPQATSSPANGGQWDGQQQQPSHDGQWGGQQQPQSGGVDWMAPSSGAASASASAPTDGYAQGAWQPSASAPSSSQGQELGAWGAPSPSSSAAGGWGGAPTPTPSPAAGQWNPDGTAAAAVAAVGPFAAASVYQATALEAFQSYEGNGTWFEASQHYGACGSAANKTDFVVALPNAMWLNSTQGSETAPSSFCGKEVLLTNRENGLSIKAWVTERCAYCVGDTSLDLSIPVFSALSSSNLDAGVLTLMWGFTGNSSSLAAPAGALSASASAAASSTSSSTGSGGWFWRRGAPTPGVVA